MPSTTDPLLIVVIALIALVGTIIGGAGGAELIKYIIRRRPRQQVAITSQIDLARQTQLYAQQLEEDARQARESERLAWMQARAHAAEAWRQADETQQKLVIVNRKLDETMSRVVEMGRYMEALVTRIYAPDATLDGIRQWLANTPPPSGSALNTIGE